jgi:hypothetical protein
MVPIHVKAIQTNGLDASFIILHGLLDPDECLGKTENDELRRTTAHGE